MICPKCGRPVDENAVICRGCDFIMDTDFLGDGILDEEHSLRPGAGGVDAAAFNLADAVILGNIDEDSSSFETSDSGFHLSQHLNARLYVSGRSQAAMSPDAVPARASTTDTVRLTPFEKHVLNYIDGKRPVEVIRRAAGLDEAEVKTALATLADKGVIKVVGRALAEMDFDGETAPRSPFRRARVRGSIVGAVALVGDDADRAIEEAFRTQVSLSPLARQRVLEPEQNGGGDGGPIKVEDAAAGPTGPQLAPERSASVPSDADPFVDLKGTDEIERQAALARPPAPKQAVNQQRRSPPPPLSSGSLESAEASLLEDSDGFDEFSDPSDLATAMVKQTPSASDPAVARAAERAAEKVVGHPVERAVQQQRRAASPAELSASGAALAGLEELADSRVQARPSIPRPPEGRRPPAQASPRPGIADPPKRGTESPSQEREREAASGEVWDVRPPGPRAPDEPPKPRTHDSSLSELLSDSDPEEPTANVPPELARALVRRSSAESHEEPTAAGQPMPPQALPRVGRMRAHEAGDATGRVRVPKSRSAMASMPDEQILDADGDIDEHSSLHAAARLGLGAADALFDGEDGDALPPEEPPEDTAQRRGRPGDARDSIDASEDYDPVPVPARPPRAAQERAQFVDGDSEPSRSGADAHGRVEGSVDDLPNTGDLDNVFQPGGRRAQVADDDDESLFENDDASALAASGSDSRDASDASVPIDPSDIEDQASAFASAAGPTAHLRRDSSDSTNDVPARVARPAAAAAGALVSTHAHSIPSEETLAPSQVSEAHAPPPPARRSARDAEKAPPPAVTEEPPRAPLPPPARKTTQPRRAPPPDESSSEMLDSALLIRPAAKVVPLASAVASVKQGSRPKERRAGLADPPSRPLHAAPPDSIVSEEVGSSEQDMSAAPSELPGDDSVEATQNLSREGVAALKIGAHHGAVAGGRNAPALPSDLPDSSARDPRGGPPRAKPTDDMRRKGRQLFDEAKKEFAAGRVGAARMNAKLASIYDPENQAYQEALEAWDDSPGAKPKRTVAVHPVNPRESEPSSALNSDELQREMHAIYDEAQDFENQGEFDDALEVLYRGVDRFPNAAAFHNRIGVLLAMKKRDFDGAISSIQRAIELDPNNLHYKNNLGKVMQRIRPRA